MAITYFSTDIEHAIVFTRVLTGEQINFSVQHFGSCQEVSLVVFSDDPDEPIIREEVTLNYQEARLLRDLLNRPEVQQVLDTE